MQYSTARATAETPRNFALADRIVQRALDIIFELAPLAWTLENPQTGYLRTRDVVVGLPFLDLCYCRYSDGVNHKYRKCTRLWGVLPGFVPRPLCTPHYTLETLYSMPKALTDDIAAAAWNLRAC